MGYRDYLLELREEERAVNKLTRAAVLAKWIVWKIKLEAQVRGSNPKSYAHQRLKGRIDALDTAIEDLKEMAMRHTR